MKHEVEVFAEWRSSHTFEFDTEEEADQFRDVLDDGGAASLDAIIKAGDVTSDTAELTDWGPRA